MSEDEGIPELQRQLEQDAKVLLKHAIDHGVPAEWYFHHLQGHMFRATQTISSDMDFMLCKGPEALRFYDARIKEYTRRIPIFGERKDIDPSEAISEVLSLIEKGIQHCPDRSECLNVIALAGTPEGRTELRLRED